MRIAIIHDYIKEYGGAERVLEALHEIWPDSHVYTTLYLPEYLGPHRKRFDGWDIRTSWFQKIPFAHKLISPLRLLSPWVFENLNLNEYDVIIVSATGAYFPNLILRQPRTRFITYCHTPPRYLYGYPTARKWSESGLGKVAATLVNHELRKWDFMSYQRPDGIIANSLEVKKRIEKFYRREAEIVYPPVEMVDVISKLKSQNSNLKTNPYYLTGGRLARAKHVDLIIHACNELKLPLKVFGRSFAGYGEELKKIAGPTIEFVGEVSDDALIELYSHANALLYASEYEDFGIIPVEAQACGIPVIGPDQGGVKETVIHGKTGILYDEISVEGIKKAIELLSYRAMKPEVCMKNAKRFSKKRFQEAIQKRVLSSK